MREPTLGVHRGGLVMRGGVNTALAATGMVCLVGAAFPWSNGPAGNAWTDEQSECAMPPYATHDWIAEHALELLPVGERAWIEPHRALYILGTEAPDNDDIPLVCGGPHTGYDDRHLGHSVEWNEDLSQMVRDRCAVRAQEEYAKAEAALRRSRGGRVWEGVIKVATAMQRQNCKDGKLPLLSVASDGEERAAITRIFGLQLARS